MEAEGRRYRVLETIGKGGFGTVYKAELLGQGGFVKSVALKMLNDGVAAAEGMSERLRDEARMLGLLRHRAIVQVDGLLQLDGRWTIAMEYIEGVDLKQLLTRGPLPVGVAIEIIQEVANALYVAYERPATPAGPLRLLHRDIKPSNILLSVSGDIKILDFGVARAEFEAREARTQALAFGSLAYMSPERLENVNLHAGDVYALGAVLYELITAEPLGRTTGQPDDHLALVDRAMERLWDTTTDEELYQLIAECLAYNPEVRPPARELERRLRNVRRRFEEPWLSDWAEGIVPGVLAEIERPQDENAGKVVLEARGFTPPGSPVPTPAQPAEAEPPPPVVDEPAAPQPEQAEQPESDFGDDEPAPRSSVPIVLAAVLSAGLVVGIGIAAIAVVKSRQGSSDDIAVNTADDNSSTQNISTSNQNGDPATVATDPVTPPEATPPETTPPENGTGADGGTDPAGGSTGSGGAGGATDGGGTSGGTTGSGGTGGGTTGGGSTGGGTTGGGSTGGGSTGGGSSGGGTTGGDGGSGGGSSGGGSSGGGSTGGGGTGGGGSGGGSTGGGSTGGGSTGGGGDGGGGGSAARFGQVALLGDMTGVQLVKGSKTYSSGKVPVGTYTVRATVDGAVKEMGTVTVAANKTVTVTCKKGFPFCVVR